MSLCSFLLCTCQRPSFSLSLSLRPLVAVTVYPRAFLSWVPWRPAVVLFVWDGRPILVVLFFILNLFFVFLTSRPLTLKRCTRKIIQIWLSKYLQTHRSGEKPTLASCLQEMLFVHENNRNPLYSQRRSFSWSMVQFWIIYSANCCSGFSQTFVRPELYVTVGKIEINIVETKIIGIFVLFSFILHYIQLLKLYIKDIKSVT